MSQVYPMATADSLRGEAIIVTRLEAVRDSLPWPSPEFDTVHALIADLNPAPAFNEAAFLTSLEAQWEATRDYWELVKEHAVSGVALDAA